MTTIIDKGLGLERVQREAFLVLFNNLNEEIAILESAWMTLDEQLAAAANKQDEPIALEQIDDINFYMGHRPSLIEAPITRYPNVSLMAYQTGPGIDNLDQMNTYSNRLFIEIMVKSPTYVATTDGITGEEQFEAERVVNSRIQRTTDAVNNVILANKTLNGTVQGITRVPNIIISDVFIRKERTSYGPNWLWQGSRLEYEVSKVARIDEAPSTLGTGLVHREGLNVDQIP